VSCTRVTKVSCTRVTEMERSRIYVLRQAGKGNNEIARIIGRDKGAVSREARRNKGRKGYRHQQAHRKAEERAARPGPRRFADEVGLDAEEKLGKGWSPEAICGRAKLEGRAHVCKETVCKHVYAAAKAGGDHQ
jgi:IS30 family transposase